MVLTETAVEAAARRRMGGSSRVECRRLRRRKDAAVPKHEQQKRDGYVQRISFESERGT